MRGRELKQEGQLVKEGGGRARVLRRQGWRPLDRWRGGRRRSIEKLGKCLQAIARLDTFDVGQVLGAEQLSPAHHADKLCFGLEHFSDARGCRAIPIGARDQISSALVARSAATDIGEVIGVLVHQLEHEVPPLFYRRHGKNDGLGAQVQTRHGIRRVGIRRDERGVVRREYPCDIQHRVKGTLVFRVALVNAEGIHGLVFGHDGSAVDVGLFRDGLDLLR
ncbi:hypothetical protein D3C72_1614410 [compost metagenome]